MASHYQPLAGLASTTRKLEWVTLATIEESQAGLLALEASASINESAHDDEPRDHHCVSGRFRYR